MVDPERKEMNLAFEGFMKKKLERLNRSALISKVKRKWVVFHGEVQDVDYS